MKFYGFQHSNIRNQILKNVRMLKIHIRSCPNFNQRIFYQQAFMMTNFIIQVSQLQLHTVFLQIKSQMVTMMQVHS